MSQSIDTEEEEKKQRSKLREANPILQLYSDDEDESNARKTKRLVKKEGDAVGEGADEEEQEEAIYCVICYGKE